jgi:tRNA modification GTPase
MSMTFPPAEVDLQTIAVLLTPPGRGAVASVLVAGPRAIEMVCALFQPAVNRGPGLEPYGSIRFGRWNGTQGEEVVVAALAADRVEIHGHGGIVAPRAILASLAAGGCQVVDWRDWAAESSDDPFVATATIALAAAPTQRTACVLLDQYQGALGRACSELASAVLHGAAADARQLVQQLLDRAPLGLHLVDPWKVVLAGPPNVGKSSLVNALVGYQRAIVYDAPGTTRDVVTAAAAFGGWPVEIADTAGLRTGADSLEAAGIERAEAQLRSADAVALVFDIRARWQPADQALVDHWPGCIVVYNKCDLAGIPVDGRPPGHCTSATSRAGLAELELTIQRRLVPQDPADGVAVPFTSQIVASLRTVRAAIDRGDMAQAQAVLWQLTAARKTGSVT